MKKKLAVVIPHYRQLTKSEKESLVSLNKNITKYDKFFMLPKRLKDKRDFNKNNYEKIIVSNSNLTNSGYLTGIRSYNKLLLSPQFYKYFTDYEFILIYQLDALIFSSNIEHFLNLDYDYIGAPMLKSKIGFLTNPVGGFNVGCNGGLSLRRVKSFLKVIEVCNKEASIECASIEQSKGRFVKSTLVGKSRKKWLAAPAHCYPFNEDGFWSYEAVKYLPSFKVAPFETALKFAFERYPRKCYKLNNNKLPFGTHAWEKYDKEFWNTHLPTSS